MNGDFTGLKISFSLDKEHIIISEKINRANNHSQMNLLHIIIDAYTLKTVAEHNFPFRDDSIDLNIYDDELEKFVDRDNAHYRTRSKNPQIFVWNNAK